MTTNVFQDDPWANDSAPADPWASEEAYGTTVEAEPEIETKETKTVAVPAEDPIVLTFKQGGGYDAPWVVLRARTVEEANALAVSAHTGGLFETVSKAAAAFAATKGGPSQAPAQQYQQPTPQAAPQQQTPQSGGDGRTCGPNGAHGQMKYWEGTTKKGTYAKLYFCQLPNGDPNKCRTIAV